MAGREQRFRVLDWTALAAAIVALGVVGLRTITNSTFWRHLAQGRYISQSGIPRVDPFSFTRAGQAWVDTTWLYDRLLYFVWNAGGAAAVGVVHIALILFAIILVGLVARRLSGIVGLGVTILFAAWVISPVMEPGPRIPAVTLAALMLWAAHNSRSSAAEWVVAILAQLIWVNIHHSFLLGPAIYGLVAAERYIRGARKNESGAQRTAVQTLALTLALAAICLVNPYGFRMIGAATGELLDSARQFAVIWISPFSGQFAWGLPRWLVTGSLAVMAIGLFGYQQKLPVTLTALCILSAFTAMRSMLHVDFYGVLAFPFWAISFQTFGDILVGRTGLDRMRQAGRSVVLAGVVVLSAYTVWYFATGRYYVSSGSAARFGLGVETDLWPAEAAEVLGSQSFPMRVVNVAPDGDYLMWALPERKVFTDSRTRLFGRRFYEELHGPILMGEEHERQSLLEKWDADVIVLNTCQPYGSLALRNLLAGGHWLLVYFDGTTAVLLSASERSQRIVSPEMQTAGLRLMDQARAAYAEALRRGRPQRNPPRLIGAAQVLLNMAQYEEAANLYEMLTRGNPRFAGGWSNLGICYVQLGRAEEATRVLRRAVALRPRNYIAWLWLSRAEAMVGDEEAARHAYQRAYRLDSGAAVAFGNPLAGLTNTSGTEGGQ